MRPFSRKRRPTESASGAISVEIIVMLPVFAVLLLAVSYLHALGRAELDAAAAARACVWVTALRGCPAASVPLCQQLEARPATPERSAAGTLVAVGADGVWSIAGQRFAALAQLPVLGRLLGALSPGDTQAEASRRLPVWAADSGAPAENSAFFRLFNTCNPRAERWSPDLANFVSQLAKP